MSSKHLLTLKKMTLRKFKDIFADGHNIWLFLMAAATIVFLFIWIVGPGNTIRHWVKAKMENRANERQIEQYMKEIAEMDKRIDMLETDRDSLEKFAREHFGFAEPKEDVYIIEQ